MLEDSVLSHSREAQHKYFQFQQITKLWQVLLLTDVDTCVCALVGSFSTAGINLCFSSESHMDI